MNIKILIEINEITYLEHITRDNIFSEINVRNDFKTKTDLFVTDRYFFDTFLSYKYSFYFFDYEYKYFKYYNDI